MQPLILQTEGGTDLTDAQAAFWHRFCADTGHHGPPRDCDSFGGPDIANELLALVLTGRKRATCTNARWIATGAMPMPVPGGLSLITGADGTPTCVIETTSVTIKPFREATPHFAWREGEGNRMLYDWRRAHLQFFHRESRGNGYVFREGDMCAFEEFECIWQE